MVTTDDQTTLGDPRAAALEFAQTLLAGGKGRWPLAPVTLVNESKATPLVYKAAALIDGALAGQNLLTPLAAIKRRNVTIALELFDDDAAMRLRSAEIEGELRNADPNGYTTPFKNQQDKYMIARNQHGKPAGFHVLIRVRSSSPTSAIASLSDRRRGHRDYVRLRFALTIFHELLHVWWYHDKARPDRDYTRLDRSGLPPLEVIDNSGHGDVQFDIDPTTLKLNVSKTVGAQTVDIAPSDIVTEANIRAFDEPYIVNTFKTRLDGFVDEVVQFERIKDRLPKR
jgi:hypothetical protein